MLLQPSRNEVGNLGVVLLLEHEVAVTVDVLVGQIDDRSVASVSIILLGEVAALSPITASSIMAAIVITFFMSYTCLYKSSMLRQPINILVVSPSWWSKRML